MLKRFKGALVVNSTSLPFLIASQCNVSFRFPYHCFNGYQCTVLHWQPFNCQNWMNVYIIQFEEDLSCINDFWVTLNIIRNLKSRIFFGPVCWSNENTSLNVCDLVNPKGRAYKTRFLSNSAKVRYEFAEETPFPMRLRFSKGDFLSEELFDSRNCKIISRMKEDTEWCSLNAQYNGYGVHIFDLGHLKWAKEKNSHMVLSMKSKGSRKWFWWISASLALISFKP